MAIKKTSPKKTVTKKAPTKKSEEASQKPIKASDPAPEPKKASAEQTAKALSGAVAFLDA